jgi:hypothetical protein
LRPPNPESIFAVYYELFIAAFGILWAAYNFAPDDLSGAVVQPMVAVGGGLLGDWFLLGLASPVEGLPLAGWSFAREQAPWFTIWVPDVISVGVLFWAVVVARRIGLRG